MSRNSRLLGGTSIRFGSWLDSVEVRVAGGGNATRHFNMKTPGPKTLALITVAVGKLAADDFLERSNSSRRRPQPTRSTWTAPGLLSLSHIP